MILSNIHLLEIYWILEAFSDIYFELEPLIVCNPLSYLSLSHLH